MRILVHIQKSDQCGHGSLYSHLRILQLILRIHLVELQGQQIGAGNGGNLMTLQTDTVKRIRRLHIVLGQLVIGLRHRQIKEISNRLFRNHFRIINEFLLHLLEFQRFNLPVPTERIVTQQALRVPHTERHTGILGIFVLTKVTHVFQVRLYIESTTCQVEILLDSQSSTRAEHLLFTIHIHVSVRVIPLRNVTIILRRNQVQGKTRQTVGLVSTVFPITGQIHVLIAKSRQGTVIRQTDGFLQIESYCLLCIHRQTQQTYPNEYFNAFHVFLFYDR